MNSNHHASLPGERNTHADAGGDLDHTNRSHKGAASTRAVIQTPPASATYAAITVDACHECGRGFTRNLLWPIYKHDTTGGASVLWCEACIETARDRGLA